MAEETQEQLQGSQESPLAEESTEGTQEIKETGQDQSQVPENNEQPNEQSKHSEDQQAQGAEDQSGQVNKPSRAEKRIADLSSKYKELVTKLQTPLTQDMPQLITDEEIKNGEVDLKELNNRINQLVDYKVNQAGSSVEQQIELKSEYKAKQAEFDSDLSNTTFENDIVKEMAEKQFEALNFYDDPISGKQVFIPAVKMSEIKAKLDTGIKAAAEKLIQGNRDFAQSVSNSQTVPTGNSLSSTSADEATSDFSKFEKTFSK